MTSIARGSDPIARRRAVALGCALLAVLAMPAGAEVYKWTDERGVVNYTSTPPKARASERLTAEDSRLTVVPAPREELERAASTARQLGRDRVARESATERERAATVQNAAPSPRAEQLRAWRERCIAEKWADCDDERALFARYNTDPRYGLPYRFGFYGAPVVMPGTSLAGRPGLPAGQPLQPAQPAQPPQPYAPMARIGPAASAPAAVAPVARPAAPMRNNQVNGGR